MKIAIVARLNSENTKDLVRVCDRLSVECKVYEASTITVDTDTIGSNDFFSHDVYIFRGYNKSYHQIQALAQYLQVAGKIVLDNVLAAGFIPSKFYEALMYEQNSIPHPRTYFFRSPKALEDLSISYPIVVKDVDSQHGKGVRLCESEEELLTEVLGNEGSTIVQEFVAMTHDVRVICIGDTIVGALKRNVVEGDFRSNVSLGSNVEPYDLTDADREIAMKAHRALGYDISGVDLGHDAEGNPFVIETNISPEWQGFQRATRIDVAARIIAYAKERFESAKS